jgi:predicted TPR repeat methyltransferase
METAKTETAPDEMGRLRERLLIDPRDVSAMRDLAGLLERSGDLAGAVDLHQRALRVDPYRLDAILDLGRLWRELADVERAKSWYRRALTIDPDCAEAEQGLRGAEENDTLSQAYIRTLFDQYADRFDRELTGTLGYRAPELAASLLARQGLPEGAADILDLGCGTGLSGLALKRFARRLDGVDLSPGMIGKARDRQIYRELAVGEARQHLEASSAGWDVIAAIDVLNYIGDLAPVFRAAAARLVPGGVLVGTVEKRSEGGLTLTQKRRYAHGLDALLEAFTASSLQPVEIVEDTLRTEGGRHVAGIIFAARAP